MVNKEDKTTDSLLLIEAFAERAQSIQDRIVALGEKVRNSEQFLASSSQIKSDLASLKSEFYTVQALNDDGSGGGENESFILQQYSARITDLEMKFRVAFAQGKKELLLPSNSNSHKNNALSNQRSNNSNIHSNRNGGDKFDVQNEKEASKRIAATLANLLEIVTAEVDRSGRSVEKLADSGSVLRKTRDEFKGFQSLLQTSSRLVHDLYRGERRDFWMIFGAFLVFLGAFLWVFKVRFLGTVKMVIPWR